MARRFLIKSRIKNVTEYILAERSRNNGIFFGLSNEQQDNRLLKIIWMLVIATCFSICVYQNGERIDYYLNYPTWLDVYNDKVTEYDMPKVTFCKTMHGMMSLDPHYPFDYIWNVFNTTDLIGSAYLTKMGNITQNLSLETSTTVNGVCSSISIAQPSQLEALTTKMNIVFNKAPFFLYVSFGAKKSNMVTSFTRAIEEIYYLRFISVSVEKFIFLNRKNKPCLTSEEYDKCQTKCEQEKFAWVIAQYLNSSCRFPYMTMNKTLPVCESLSVIPIFINLHEGKQTKYNVSCVCHRQCEQTFYYKYSTIANPAEEIKQIFLLTPVLRLFKERMAYDLTALLCDIGGNISLYLGLSCLTLWDVIFNIGFHSNRLRKLAPLKNHPLFNKISNEYRKLTLKRDVSKVRLTLELLYFKLKHLTLAKYSCGKVCVVLLKIFVICLAVFQMFELALHYLAFPTAATIDLKDDIDYDSVDVVFCWPPTEILLAKKEYTRSRNVSLNDVRLIDLLDKKQENFSNFEKLWQLSSNFKTNYFDFGVRPEVTVFGNCSLKTQFEGLFAFSKFEDYITEVDGGRKSVTMCEPFDIEIYPTPHNHLFNPKTQMIFECGSLVVIKFKRQMIIRTNTSVAKCVGDEEWQRCEAECYYSKILLSRNLNCSLPFTTFLDLPLCDSIDSAEITYDAYLSAFLTTDPVKDCSCHIKCNEVIFTFATKNIFRTFECSIDIRPENLFLEIIENKLNFPLIKLFCDIGSNLGSILGISLLSGFKIVEHILNLRC